MKKIALLTIVLGICLMSNGQNKRNDSKGVGTGPTMSVFAELGGPGVASLNFDTRFTNRQDGIGGRIGIGGFSIDGASIVFVPIGINYLIGKDGKNYFEVGGGITPVIASENYNSNRETFSTSFGHISLGYRLQPTNSGFTFRAAIVPIFGKSVFWPYYGGVSFGYKF